jgi:hypothetical protein
MAHRSLFLWTRQQSPPLNAESRGREWWGGHETRDTKDPRNVFNNSMELDGVLMVSSPASVFPFTFDSGADHERTPPTFHADRVLVSPACNTKKEKHKMMPARPPQPPRLDLSQKTQTSLPCRSDLVCGWGGRTRLTACMSDSLGVQHSLSQWCGHLIPGFMLDWAPLVKRRLLRLITNTSPSVSWRPREWGAGHIFSMWSFDEFV